MVCHLRGFLLAYQRGRAGAAFKASGGGSVCQVRGMSEHSWDVHFLAFFPTIAETRQGN